MAWGPDGVRGSRALDGMSPAVAAATSYLQVAISSVPDPSGSGRET